MRGDKCLRNINKNKSIKGFFIRRGWNTEVEKGKVSRTVHGCDKTLKYLHKTSAI
jgi:hypothetical protein